MLLNIPLILNGTNMEKFTLVREKHVHKHTHIHVHMHIHAAIYTSIAILRLYVSHNISLFLSLSLQAHPYLYK